MNLRAWKHPALAVAFFFLATGSTAAQEPVLECPFDYSGGDLLFRGFYIPAYPSDDLDRVELLFVTTFTDTYTISLTARAGTYDGPILGVSTIELEIVAGSEGFTAADNADAALGGPPTTLGVFNFGAVPVAEGSTVTFALEQLAGKGSVYYDVGPCGFDEPGCEKACTGGVIQTNATEPPLDTFRRASVGIRVFSAPTGVPALGIAGASVLALCLLVALSRMVLRS